MEHVLSLEVCIRSKTCFEKKANHDHNLSHLRKLAYNGSWISEKTVCYIHSLNAQHSEDKGNNTFDAVFRHLATSVTVNRYNSR